MVGFRIHSNSIMGSLLLELKGFIYIFNYLLKLLDIYKGSWTIKIMKPETESNHLKATSLVPSIRLGHKHAKIAKT